MIIRKISVEEPVPIRIDNAGKGINGLRRCGFPGLAGLQLEVFLAIGYTSYSGEGGCSPTASGGPHTNLIQWKAALYIH